MALISLLVVSYWYTSCSSLVGHPIVRFLLGSYRYRGSNSRDGKGLSWSTCRAWRMSACHSCDCRPSGTRIVTEYITGGESVVTCRGVIVHEVRTYNVSITCGYRDSDSGNLGERCATVLEYGSSITGCRAVICQVDKAVAVHAASLDLTSGVVDIA